MISGFILSIPVFFDTVFLLLIPLGITLALKTGKNFVLYVVAIGGGAVITHSIVPPTPGPLIMAETLGIDLGTAILGGLIAGIVPAIVVLGMAKWLNKKLRIPVRVINDHVTSIPNPPSLALSILPVLVPLLMISLASVVQVVTGSLPGWIAFQGNKNIAMGVGAFLALFLWAGTQKLTIKGTLESCCQTIGGRRHYYSDHECRWSLWRHDKPQRHWRCNQAYHPTISCPLYTPGVDHCCRYQNCARFRHRRYDYGCCDYGRTNRPWR